jgi:hypothetical protein
MVLLNSKKCSLCSLDVPQMLLSAHLTQDHITHPMTEVPELEEAELDWRASHRPPQRSGWIRMTLLIPPFYSHRKTGSSKSVHEGKRGYWYFRGKTPNSLTIKTLCFGWRHLEQGYSIKLFATT